MFIPARGARDAIVRLVRPHAPERALKSLVATMVIKNTLLGETHGTITEDTTMTTSAARRRSGP